MHIKIYTTWFCICKMGHTFQDQNVSQGHITPCIIVHPGPKKWNNAVQAWYACLRRIYSDWNTSQSGLFFCRNNMNRDRISNLRTTKERHECVKVKHRRKWVEYLERNKCSTNISRKDKDKLINWVKNTRVDEHKLQNLIDDNSWRTSEMLNIKSSLNY